MAERELILPVSGMTCANCAATVERALSKTPGVTEAAVNYGSERASITFDPRVVSTAALAERVRDVGYDVPTQTFDLALTGMTCANCAATIQRTMHRKVPGCFESQ